LEENSTMVMKTSLRDGTRISYQINSYILYEYISTTFNARRGYPKNSSFWWGEI